MSHTSGKWVAECYGTSGTYDNPEDLYEVVADGHVRVCESAGEADARLIAAAPDLLEALKGLRDSFGPETMNAALEAIAKAEGK